jgi:pyridoxamine 5'-phosphate oxidase
MSVADLRQEYTLHGLTEADVPADPIPLFETWLQQAVAANLREPNAMTLATVSADGRPSARIVLLKGIDARGFAFFTNYESRKGHELNLNHWAALVFFWPELERQVRVEGMVERTSAEESDGYFRLRPVGSRVGAWVSPQSRVIDGRADLDHKFYEALTRYENQEVPRPPFWGGFRVRHASVEFWQGRPNRLHDRLRYRRDDDGNWVLERLAP